MFYYVCLDYFLVWSCYIEMPERSEEATGPLVLTARPGYSIQRVASAYYGSNLLVTGASSKCNSSEMFIWSLPPPEERSNADCSSKSHQTLHFDNGLLLGQVFGNGRLMSLEANGTVSMYRCNSDTNFEKISSETPFQTSSLSNELRFTISSSASGSNSSNSRGNEFAHVAIDSQETGRVVVFGLFGDQQSSLEIVQDFNYAPILGNMATACAVRCSSAGGSPLLVIGDMTGRLHFFDLRLSNIAEPVFTKAGGAGKPITCIGLHPYSNETVTFGSEDGAISMMDLRVVSKETTSSAAGQTAFQAHNLSVTGIAFDSIEPDRIFSCGSDGLLLEWNWPNQQTSEEMPTANPIFSKLGVPLNCLTAESGFNNATSSTVIAGSAFGEVYVIN